MPVQNTAARYLKKTRLQRLLEQLFPGQTEFFIEMRDDQWCFIAPEQVADDDLNNIRDD